jgi:hypothetical protein
MMADDGAAAAEVFSIFNRIDATKIAVSLN